MNVFKKYQAHLFLILLIMGAGVTWGLFLLNPQGAEVKEIADPGYVPGPPQNLQATAVSQTEIDLQWTAPYVDELQLAYPNQYIIYRSTTGNDFATIGPLATIPASVTHYEDTSVAAGTAYYYKVAARNATGEGGNSNMASATTPAPFVPEPLNLAATTRSSQEIELTWTISPGSFANSYDIYRKKSGEQNFALITTLPITTQFVDSNLSSDTSYVYYVIARSGAFLSNPSNEVAATTLASDPILPAQDTTPPELSNIQIIPTTNSARILWKTNEPATSEVQYGLETLYTNKLGEENFVTDHQTTLVNLFPNTLYYFQVASVDQSGNRAAASQATFMTLKEKQPLPSVSGLQITTSTNALILSWINPLPSESPEFQGVVVVRKIMNPSQNSTDGTVLLRGKDELLVDKTALVDTNYFYTIFSFDSEGNYSSGASVEGKIPVPAKAPEICNPQAVDCAKEVCKRFAVCQKKSPPTIPPTKQPTSQNNKKLNLLDFTFLAANNEITLVPRDGILTSLHQHVVRILFDSKKLPSRPSEITLRVAGQEPRQFIYDKTRAHHYNDIQLPQEGWYEAHLAIRYSNKENQEIPFLIHSLPSGRVVDKEEKEVVLPGSEIILLDESGKKVNLTRYGQSNPSISSSNGSYGWLVPNGKYYITVKKQGYKDMSTSLFEVNNNVINSSLELTNTAVALSSVTSARPLFNSSWNTFLNKVVAPISLGIAGASLLAQVSLFNLLALLRLLFLQPILLIGSRKRQAWGEVYNSLNKLPVDLAIVRLINSDNKIVQSIVTGRGGKYYFRIGPGKYRMEVSKNKMVFPSALLKSYNSDGRKPDLYHGEMFVVKDQYPIITANIPGDPIVENVSLNRLRWERVGRVLQFIISISGLGITLYSLYISPSAWHLWLLAAAHIMIFLLFYRLSIPPRPKGWGVVYDNNSRKPLSRSIVRLFNTHFNKLVAAQATDHRGRYYFLAGDSEYQLSFDHQNYELKKSDIIDLKGKEEENVAVNIGLQKK